MPPGVYIRTKSVWNKGLTKESDPRILTTGVFKKGHVPFNKGKHGLQPSPSPEHIAFLKKLNSKRMKSHNPMKNKFSMLKMKQTNERNGSYIRMGKEARKRMLINNPMFMPEVIKNHPTLHSGLKFRSKGEQIVNKVLKDLGLKFKRQYRIRRHPTKRSYFLDFYLFDFNVGVEFDGDSRHFSNPELDQVRDNFLLKNRNLRILRILPKSLNCVENLKKEITLFLSSGFKFSKIKKIKKTSKSVRVFDLNIRKNKNFFVNGKLVHNCPMPFNADTWDGVRCPYGCRYCFADSFRASLYTSFFDNSKTMGLRYCRPEYFRAEMSKIMRFRGKKPEGNEIQRAISMEIPIRLGIRFEDFIPIEVRKGVSLDFLKYLAEEAYPVMINTKSDLIGREEYVRALSDNKGKSAVHITMISSNPEFNKKIEPGAPSFERRLEAAKSLTNAGVRVVGRIEPFMVFINDNYDDVLNWIEGCVKAGIKNVTLDTYSWSAGGSGVGRQLEMEGFDYDRMFTLMSESQWLGSLLLTKFIEWLREFGFSCSTFDFGSVPSNDQDVCCEVGDWYKGFSYGNTLMAIRYIVAEAGVPVTWEKFEKHVEAHGGWLSEAIRTDVYNAWNLSGNGAYFTDWARGVELFGVDEKGRKVWVFNKSKDYREELLKLLINK